MAEIHLSVRELVEFLLRAGDLDNRSGAASEDAMLAGSRMHRKLQEEGGSEYRAEVTLHLLWEYGRGPVLQQAEGEDDREDMFRIEIEGRADGIVPEVPSAELLREFSAPSSTSEKTSAGSPGEESCPIPKVLHHPSAPICMIDEIKTTYRNLRGIREPEPVHLAQAKCYAYIHALQEELPFIGVRMTYCSLATGKTKRFREIYTFDRLQAWFADLMEQYRPWARLRCEWTRLRTDSIRSLPFPYPYRPGQKDLAAAVYRTIIHGRKLYLEAPTGTGKTLSVLYPAIKAMGEGKAAPIFYLTAKTITRTAAEQAVELLRTTSRPRPEPEPPEDSAVYPVHSDRQYSEDAVLSPRDGEQAGRRNDAAASSFLKRQGLRLRNITLTAKEKICILDHPECNPELCPRAKGHFDRVNDAMYDVLTQEDGLTRSVIESCAERHQVCPFEFGLDLSLYADLIIGDYNYVFDPHARLRRFFAEGTESGDHLQPVFLVDEAHNLVDRGREMYSADLTRGEFLSMRRMVRKLWPQLARRFSRCSRVMLALQRSLTGQSPESDLSVGAAAPVPTRNLSDVAPEDLPFVKESLAEQAGTSERSEKEEEEDLSRLVPGSRLGYPPYQCVILGDIQAFTDAVMDADIEIGSVLSEERIAEQSGAAMADPLLPAKRAVMEELLEFYYRIDHFSQMAADADESYVPYAQELPDGSFMVRLLCVDPGTRLRACMDRARSTILFSATLLPITYYKKLLGGTAEDYEIYAQSVFDPDRMGLFIVRDLTSRYRQRTEQNYLRMADCIYQVISQRHGNYLVFFPSYAFLNETAQRLLQFPGIQEYIITVSRRSRNGHQREEPTDTEGQMSLTLNPFPAEEAGPDPDRQEEEPSVPEGGTLLLRQQPGMREEEREAFLSRFSEVHDDRSLVGLCVIGGIFGEGIDLKNDSLIGVIVIGTGIPQVSGERELIREYFDTEAVSGYDYAYRFPGMNRVQQAAGRVIRTMEDVGIVVLIDERFAASSTRRLFPREWRGVCTTDSRHIAHEIERFWNEWL